MKHSKIFIIFLVLCGILTMGVFVTEAEAKTKISFMLWGGAKDVLVESVQKAYPDIAEEIEVEFVVGGRNAPETAEKLRLALAANDGIPDILQVNSLILPEFAAAGVFEDLTDHIKPYMDSLPEGVKRAASWDGKIIGFPYTLIPKMFYYRKDMFDEAEIDPTQLKTVDDFIALGKKLQETFPESHIWNLGPQSMHYDLYEVMVAYDGRLHDENGNYVVETDPGMRKAFETLHRIRKSGVVADVVAWTPDWEAGFADNTIAGQLTFSWFKSFIPRYAPDQEGKWDITLWPDEIEQGGGMELFCVPAGAANKEAAIKWLTHLRLKKEGALAVFESTGNFPVTYEGMQDPKVREPHPYFGDSYLKAYEAGIDTLKIYQHSPKATLERSIIVQYLDAYMNDEMTLNAALNGAQKDLETQLGNAFD